MLAHLEVEGVDPEVQREGQHQDHAGVPEREEEAHAQRTLTLAHHLAGGVVDGGDVVRVKGVANPERERENACAKPKKSVSRRVADGVRPHRPRDPTRRR